MASAAWRGGVTARRGGRAQPPRPELRGGRTVRSEWPLTPAVRFELRKGRAPPARACRLGAGERHPRLPAREGEEGWRPAPVFRRVAEVGRPLAGGDSRPRPGWGDGDGACRRPFSGGVRGVKRGQGLPVWLCVHSPHLEQRIRQVDGAPAPQHAHHHRDRDHCWGRGGGGGCGSCGGDPGTKPAPEPFSISDTARSDASGHGV